MVAMAPPETDSPRGRSKADWAKLTEKGLALLIMRSSERRFVPYSEMEEFLGINRFDNGYVLGYIARRCKDNGWPMLPCVVTYKNTPEPNWDGLTAGLEWAKYEDYPRDPDGLRDWWLKEAWRSFSFWGSSPKKNTGKKE
jgi:hypothetical protein